jgi:hypothetical protein
MLWIHIRIRMDPHYLGNLDPHHFGNLDPHHFSNLDQHLDRIRIK